MNLLFFASLTISMGHGGGTSGSYMERSGTLRRDILIPSGPQTTTVYPSRSAGRHGVGWYWFNRSRRWTK